jgi:hypothetical protein
MNTIKNGLGARLLLAVLAWALPVAAADPRSGTEYVVKKKIYQQPSSDAYVSAHFGVDRNLGRAWIEVAASPSVDDQQRDIIARKNVKWLYYDPERKAVVYQHGATETICANDRSLLGGSSLKSTENCELMVSSAKRKVDDGFSGEKVPVTTVTFVARNFRPKTPLLPVPEPKR